MSVETPGPEESRIRWVMATGADIFELVTSGSRGWAKYYAETGASFIRIGNLDHDAITIDLSDVQCVQPPMGSEGERTRLRPGDILISITADLGMIGLVPDNIGEAYINQHIALARPCPGNDPRYIAWFLASEANGGQQIRDLRRGATKAGLGLDDIRKFRFPLAPLGEQQRIADKLDTILAQVDACRQRLDRVPGILKRFRQAVLGAATSGELTKEWRESRDRQQAQWEDTTIGALLTGKPRNGYSPRAVDYQTPVKSLTLTATTSGRFLAQHFKYIDDQVPPDSHLWLEPDDILIQRANTIEYVGVSAVFDGQPGEFVYPDLMMKCRANQRTTTKFLHCLLSSTTVRRHFRDNATGTSGNMPKINQSTVMSAAVRLPSLNEQTEIVRRVETLLAYADRLEARYAAARVQVERLTPALLAKAFRGELVHQDPDDEPASVLLERIRAARAAAPVQRKRGRRTGGTRYTKTAEVTMLNRADIARSHLTDILRQRGALTAESLWAASQLDIDDFYDQLKDEEGQGLLRENRGGPPEAPRLLEAVP